jgi:hypothetical protein
VILFKRDKIEIELAILGPHWGHALKKRLRAACFDTIDLDYLQHEMRSEI